MGPLRRLAAVAGLAGAQLRGYPTRTLLSVAGVALAVLAVTLLTATGAGVLETGQQRFAAADRDLWVTGGPVEFAPGTVGGVRNSIRDSHRLAADLSAREDVATAAPLLFQTVYARANESQDYHTIAAFGVPSAAGVRVTEGRGFSGDPHYANGTYDGPMTHEVLVDRRTAALLGVGVGDRISVGGTIAAAREHQFLIVGISPTGGRFLGAPTVTIPLSELQEVTGKTGSDPATLVTVATTDGADVGRTEREIQRAYPDYDVRTNAEQLRATVERQAVVLAASASLVALAVLAGVALSLNALLSMLAQGVASYAALKALGTSPTTLALTALCQTVVVGAVGGLVGLALAIPAAAGLNRVVAALVGFEGVVGVTPRIAALGGGVALGVGLLSGLVAAGYLARVSPLAVLR
ncbi:MAG: ABC transporter permease [Haloferacaceae archaeon]